MNNGCFVTSRKFGRTSTRVVFFVCIHMLLDSTHSRLPQTSPSLNISLREYPCSSKEMTEAQLAVEVAFMVVVRGQVEFQHVKLIQIASHDIVYGSHSHLKHCF